MMLKGLKAIAALVLVAGLSACGWTMDDGVKEIFEADLASPGFISGIYRNTIDRTPTMGDKISDQLLDIQPQADGSLYIREVWHTPDGASHASNTFAYLIGTPVASEALLLYGPSPGQSEDVMLLRRRADRSYDVFQFDLSENYRIDFSAMMTEAGRRFPACAEVNAAAEANSEVDETVSELCQQVVGDKAIYDSLADAVAPDFAEVRQIFASYGLTVTYSNLLGPAISTSGDVTSTTLRQMWNDPNVRRAMVPDARLVAHLEPTVRTEDRARLAASDAELAEPGYVVSVAGAGETQTGSRVALIVANSSYASVPLNNPTTDAKLVAAALEHMGFTTTVAENLDVDAFDTAVAAFEERAEKAEIALFYFAGHGFAMADKGELRNYLVSTSGNVTAAEERSIKRQSLALDEIVDELSRRAATTLVFIDACRSVPGRGSGAGRGLAPVASLSESNVFVGLSTLPGQIAKDGEAGNGSPFAQAFAKEMATPGMRIDDAFTRVRLAVEAATDHNQSPDVGRYALSAPLILVPES